MSRLWVVLVLAGLDAQGGQTEVKEQIKDTVALRGSALRATVTHVFCPILSKFMYQKWMTNFLDAYLP